MHASSASRSPALIGGLVAAYPALLALLRSGDRISSEAVFATVAASVGGTLANGDFTPRDAYDALEFALNRGLASGAFGPIAAFDLASLQGLVERMQDLVNRLPTQTRRTEEQVEWQQFSTPPTLAAMMAHAACIEPGDRVLDPSAGVGSLLTFAQASGALAVANELAPRRAGLLRAMGLPFVYVENADHIDATLPRQHHPQIVVMNPPFSATAGRRDGFRRSEVGAQQVASALRCLPRGGRLVALVGHGLETQSATFRSAMRRIKNVHVVADIALPGAFYKSFGTTFDNRLIVLDRIASNAPAIVSRADTLVALADIVWSLRSASPGRSVPSEGAAQFGLSFLAPCNDDGVAPVAPPTPTVSSEVLPVDRSTEATGTTRIKGKAAAAAARESSACMPEGPFDPVNLTVLDEAGRSAFDGDGVFETYLPQRFVIAGAQPHPDKLVESAAMAAVLPPVPTYRPVLPPALISEGALSLAQIEAVVYAGHCHNQNLPDGERRGFFIGDGTGVGKGREISGILLDNWLQGRRQAVWISEKPDLLTDARRDFASLSCDPLLIQPQSQFRQGEGIALGTGILFTTYATLRQSGKESTDSNGMRAVSASRVDQIVQWLGEAFEGVIVFDEAHAGGNAVALKGERGISAASQQALAMIELQERLPRARVVYVSATGATEVSNLAYATRLGLWGVGTPFVSVEAFISQVASHGISVSEIVARDMKALGVYLARSLSFADVSYSRCEHALTAEQVAIYDRLAEAWQTVLDRVDEALDITDGASCKNTKAAALSAFWGANQRFFNQVLVSMQMPTVLDQIDQDLADGKSVVLQMVNTFEAVQARAIARATCQDELDELDMTPRDVLIQYVENSFPLFIHETYTDEDGNLRSRPAQDSKGKPIECPEAKAMRDALLVDLHAIQVPDSPLDIVLNLYGAPMVAEVTGRRRRALRVVDADSGALRVKLESRSRVKVQAEAADFMAGKRRILIFSDAGGTGFSFHAARDFANQQPRVHYLVQAGWRANKAVQGFGRTHRTNQVSAPHYCLCTTDLPGHRRFLSSIARRLDSLGALTKGHRDTANQGLFSALDNLEGPYAADAIQTLFKTLYLSRGKEVDGIEFDDVCQQMGLKLLSDGGLVNSKLPSVPQFLNRLLCLKVESQGKVFEAFSTRMAAAVELARQAGQLDLGMEDLRAERIECVGTETVYTDERSGASTQAVTLDVRYPVRYYDFPTRRITGYVRNRRSGYVWAVREMPARTDRRGQLINQVKLLGPGSESIVDACSMRWSSDPVDEGDARALWASQVAAMPSHRTERVVLLTGLLLNVWDRVRARKQVRRAHTVDGRRFLGCLIPADDVAETMTALGASMTATDIQVLVEKIVKEGQQATLTNHWTLRTRRVAGEQRLEVEVPYIDRERHVRAAQTFGAFVEIHQFQSRAFLPITDGEALERLLLAHPVVKIVVPDERAAA